MATLSLSNQGFEYWYGATWDSTTATMTEDESSWRDSYLDGTGTTFTLTYNNYDSDPGALEGSGEFLFGDLPIAATTSDAVLVDLGGGFFKVLSNTSQTFPLTMTPYDGTNSEFTGPLVPCFARGTLIATPAGERAVETLAIGDRVTTAGGTAPVKWLGRKSRHVRFAKHEGALPVCITAGALGEGLPRRDLFVSPDHAMLVDGVLVHALALCNDLSIVQMSEWPHENVEYFHIELENHALVLAEGSLSETFVDTLTRKSFDNWRKYEALYGAEVTIAEMELPRVKFRRQLASFTGKRLLAIALQGQQNVA